MKRVQRIAFRLREPWISWRAARIADPVSRLRYLRKATAFSPLPDRIPKSMLILAGMAAGAALLIPSHPGYIVREVASQAPAARIVTDNAEDAQADDWLVDSRENQYEI